MELVNKTGSPVVLTDDVTVAVVGETSVDDTDYVGALKVAIDSAWSSGLIGVYDPPAGFGAPASPGIWTPYEGHTGSPPFNGITVGNGLMSGWWWTPAPVEVSVDTDPFLVHIDASVRFGSSTEVTGVIVPMLPTFVDDTELDIVLVFGEGGTQHLFPVAASIGNVPTGGTARLYDAIYTADGQQWNDSVPDNWQEGDEIHFHVAYRAIFSPD